MRKEVGKMEQSNPERRAPKPVPNEVWLPGKSELPVLPVDAGLLIPLEMPGSQPGEVVPAPKEDPIFPNESNYRQPPYPPFS